MNGGEVMDGGETSDEIFETLRAAAIISFVVRLQAWRNTYIKHFYERHRQPLSIVQT